VVRSERTVIFLWDRPIAVFDSKDACSERLEMVACENSDNNFEEKLQASRQVSQHLPDYVSNGSNMCFGIVAVHALAGSVSLCGALRGSYCRKDSSALQFANAVIRWRAVFVHNWLTAAAAPFGGRRSANSKKRTPKSLQELEKLRDGICQLYWSRARMQYGTASTPEDFILLLCGDDPTMLKTLNELSSSGYTYHTLCDSDSCSQKCLAEVLPSNSFDPVRPAVHNTTSMLHFIYGPSQESCPFPNCASRRTCSWSFRNLPPVLWIHLNTPDDAQPYTHPPFKHEAIWDQPSIQLYDYQFQYATYRVVSVVIRQPGHFASAWVLFDRSRDPSVVLFDSMGSRVTRKSWSLISYFI